MEARPVLRVREGNNPMIDGIRQNLTYMDPSARKGKAEAGGTSAPRAPSVSLTSSQGAELVEISSSGFGDTSSGAPVDTSRITAIRDAIRRNGYPVDFEKLAERMIESDLGLSPGK